MASKGKKKNQTDVQLLCHKEERFAPLAQYFKNILPEDLVLLSVEDLVSLVPPQEKLLMKVFVTRYLHTFLNLDVDPLYRTSQEYLERIEPLQEERKEPSVSSLKLSGQLLPVVFRSLAPSQGKITLEEVIIANEKRTYTVLDVSANNLMDADMPLLAKLVTNIQCQYVLLSNNRIHGYHLATRDDVDASLKAMLDCNSVKYVDITFNPLATVDKLDLWKSLTDSQLSKLVWVPEMWLSAGHWKHMLPPNNPGLVELVRKTHEAFFKDDIMCDYNKHF